MGSDTEAPKGDIAVVSSRVKWRIENFSKLSKMHFSDTFSVGCHKWRLLVYPKGAIQGNLSLYLCAVGFSKFPYVDFYLGVINQFDSSYTVRRGAHYKFTALDRARGFTSMMPLNELNGPRKGYIVEDICIVEAEISMPGVPEFQIPTSLEAHNGNSMELELSVEALVEVVTPMQAIHPVAAAPTQISELTGIMEAVAEVKVSGAANKDKYPGAGRLYEEGRYCKEVVMDEKFEEVGGFRVLKTQASLYKEIWLNYGHIASSQVLKDLYSSQVAIVTEMMTCIVDMYWYRLEEVSSELIDTWDEKIKVAEKLEFNIGWLRERLEDIKIIFSGEKKLQDILMEHDQAKSQVLEAEQQLVLANDRLNIAKERLFGLETKTSPLLLERQNFLKKCGGRLPLFDGVPHAMAPVEKDAAPTKEPIGNSNSETVPSTGIAASIPRRTRTLTTSISPANESKRKSSGDGAGDGNGQHLEKKPKASKDGCYSTPEITSTPNAKQLFSGSPIPSRVSLLPETMSPANEPKRESSGDGAGGGNGQHLEKQPKASRDGCALTFQSTSNSPMPSRGSLSPKTMSPANESKSKSSVDGAGGGNGQHLEKKPKASRDACAVTFQSISDSPMPSKGSLSPETMSPDNEPKRKSSGDGAGGGNCQHSEKNPKASKDECAATLQSISDSHMPSRGSLSPKTMSPANEPKRESSGDGAGGGNGQHSQKKTKASKDGCYSTPEITSTPNAKQLFSGSPMPSSVSSSQETTSTPNAKQLFTADEIAAVLLQHPVMTTRDLVAKFRSRLNTTEDKLAFSEVMKGICKIVTREDGTRHVLLMKN